MPKQKYGSQTRTHGKSGRNIPDFVSGQYMAKLPRHERRRREREMKKARGTK